MIKGLRFINRIGKNGRVTHFTYKGHEGWWLTERYDNATQKDFDDYVKDCKEFGKEVKDTLKRIEARRAAMTPDERARQDEADRAVFERWQDEANTNMTLDGTFKPGEDNDFNPFRKDED